MFRPGCIQINASKIIYKANALGYVIVSLWNMITDILSDFSMVVIIFLLQHNANTEVDDLPALLSVIWGVIGPMKDWKEMAVFIK